MESAERMERILAMILVNSLASQPQAMKADALSKAGFSNAEIAELLGTTSGTVGQQLYELRGAKRKNRSAKRSKRN